MVPHAVFHVYRKHGITHDLLSCVCYHQDAWQITSKTDLLTKGQFISEWKYEVVTLPKIWTKKFEKFFPEYLGQNFSTFFVHILGNATTSYFHSEINWPLTKLLSYVLLKSMGPTYHTNKNLSILLSPFWPFWEVLL